MMDDLWIDVQIAVTDTMSTNRMEVVRLKVVIVMRLRNEFLDACIAKHEKQLQNLKNCVTRTRLNFNPTNVDEIVI
jgi:hypothetical protein